MKILITGQDGFLASHLADYILEHEKAVEIWGTIRKGADRRNISHIIDQLHLVDMDLTDAYSVRNAVHTAMPDKVFSLAGQSYVPTSWTSPANTFEVNAVGTIHLLEAVRRECKDAYVQVAGSSEEYGDAYGEEPIAESRELRPLSPYGVSKVAADLVAFQYARSYGLNLLISRTFNQSGPRRGEQFFDSNWAKQIAEIEAGLRPPLIKHGNLDAVRDLSDARDTVQIYWMLSNLGYLRGVRVNVCSGHGFRMRYVLDKLIELSPEKQRIVLSPDPERMRPSDVPWLVGDPTALKALLGGVLPHRAYEKTLSDLLAYWRERISK